MTVGELLKRIVVGVLVVLLLPFAVSLVVRAVSDAPEEKVRTTSEAGAVPAGSGPR